MNTKMIWANLAVKDIERTTKFYTDLGFKPNGTPTKDITSFLFSDSGFVIHFFTEDKLKEGVNEDLSTLSSGKEIIFSLSAENKEAVEIWAERVKKAGGTVFNEPRAMGEGYDCGFADPDGHKFNVLYWPG